MHGPWALAIGARLRERFGIDAQAMAGDDGIVVRIPETDAEPPGAALALFEPDEIDDLVTTEVGGSALFASRFRECAARALLLPRRDPGRRSPLWQQRQRSAALLEVASKYGSFPIVLEAVRECLQDVYDVPALVQLMRDIESRRIRVVEVETQTPSAFARSLLFGYVASFVYEGDSPLAERKAAALALDPALLGELLGRTELRDLLDPDVVDEVAREVQWLDRRPQAAQPRGRGRRAARARSAHPRRAPRAMHRTRGVDDWVDDLLSARRAVTVRIGGQRDGRRGRGRRPGCATPSAYPCLPASPKRSPSRSPTRSATSSAGYARTHGPFTTGGRRAAGSRSARRSPTTRSSGWPGAGRVAEGEFRPGGHGSEWCDAEVLRRIRRRSLAAARREVEPVEPAALGRFLPAWQGVGQQVARARRRAVRGRTARGVRRARLGARAVRARQPGDGLPASDARRAHGGR